MKKFKIRIKLLMGTTALLFSVYSTAQLPVTGPDILISSGNPQNIGNSAVGNYLSVSCWDGTTPEIYWESPPLSGTVPISGTIDISIQDPDVVAFPGSVKFCVVYQKAGHIYAELWAPVGLTYSIIEGPIIISDGMLNNSNPNVDQLENGAAFVWQQNGKIKGRYWDLTVGGLTTPLALGNEVVFSQCFSSLLSDGSNHFSNREPDVSIYREGLQDIANVVFISYDYVTNTESLIIQRMDLDAFHLGGVVSCSESDLLMPPIASPEIYSNPRIASPPIGGALDFRDSETVVNLVGSGTQRIVGINRCSGGTYIPSTINNLLGATFCENARPVVSYTECGVIIVEWEYSDACISPPYPGNQVLARHLNYCGNSFGGYAFVNLITSTMVRPAVSGRYRTPSDNIYSTYTDGFSIYQRYSFCSSLFMRKKGISNQEIEKNVESSFYPNPANENLAIKIALEEDQSVMIQVFDIAGKEVFKTASTLGLYFLDTKAFVDGVYFVKLIIDNQIVETKKVMIRH